MELKDSKQHMRGSPHSQVEGLFHFVSGIGVSRHQLKMDKVSDTWIHSDNTRAVYVRVWHGVAAYTWEKYQISQILEIQPFQMVEWLEIQVHRGVAPATIRTYASALAKFMSALEFYKSNRQEEKRRSK